MLSFRNRLEKHPTVCTEIGDRALLQTFGMIIPNKPVKTEFHLLFTKDRLEIPLKTDLDLILRKDRL
jgi:hypothetical protein